MGIDPLVAFEEGPFSCLQAGERRVAGKEGDSSACKVEDSVRMHVPPRLRLHSKLQRHWQGLFIVVKCPKVIPTTSSRPIIFANGSYDIVTSFTSFAFAQYACLLAKTTAASRVPYKLQIQCILYYVHLKTARCRTLPTQMLSPASRVDIPSREAESCAGQTHRQDR